LNIKLCFRILDAQWVLKRLGNSDSCVYLWVNLIIYTRVGQNFFFCSRAKLQQINNAAGRNNYFCLFVHLMFSPKNTSIYGKFIQNYVHKLGCWSLRFCYRGCKKSLAGRMRTAGLSLATSDLYHTSLSNFNLQQKSDRINIFISVTIELDQEIVDDCFGIGSREDQIRTDSILNGYHLRWGNHLFSTNYNTDIVTKVSLVIFGVTSQEYPTNYKIADLASKSTKSVDT
jgi:hypothetical protein